MDPAHHPPSTTSTSTPTSVSHVASAHPKLTPLDNRRHQSDHPQQHPSVAAVAHHSAQHPFPPDLTPFRHNPTNTSHPTVIKTSSLLPHHNYSNPYSPTHDQVSQYPHLPKVSPPPFVARSTPKPSDHVVHASHASMLPHITKVNPPMAVIRGYGPNVQPHPNYRVGKNETLGVPLPLHPDPIQTGFVQQPEGVESSDKQNGTAPQPAFNFGQRQFFDDLQTTDPDPNAQQPTHPNDPQSNPAAPEGNTLAGVDSITGAMMPGVASISNLALPGIGTGGMPGGAPFGPAGGGANVSNAAIVGGASEIADVIAGNDRRHVSRRIRSVTRTRSQQMTEIERKQRHNEHTRASRSRIDRGLERLKSTIKKVQPDQKVTKKADVLQVAVKLLKEGYRLPATESDEEGGDPPDSALSV